MQENIISSINPKFLPINVPVVKGRMAFHNLKSNAFPAYVALAKPGVEIVIRSGHPFTLKYPYNIVNTQFRERFKSFLKLSQRHGITFHATVTAQGNWSEEELMAILADSTKLLPATLNAYITLCIYENSIEEMRIKNIVTLLKAIMGPKPTEFLKNVTPADYTEVKSLDGLSSVVDFLMSNGGNLTSRGVILASKDGAYTQGSLAPSDCDIVIIDSSEEVIGDVVDIKVSTKMLPGENITSADKLLIKFGDTVLPYDMGTLPLMARGFFADKRDSLIGSKVTCELHHLPSAKTVSIKKLLHFKHF